MRIEHIAASLVEIARKSDHSVHKHAAAIFVNKSILSKGYNRFDRVILRSYSTHAEIDAIYNYRRKKSRGKKYLIVIRINKAGNFINSKPCSKCIKVLKGTDISRVYYTNSNGQIICEK